MNPIVVEATLKMKALEENVSCRKYSITGEVRKISSKLFRQIDDKSAENILAICEELLNERTWAFGVIAFDFAYRIRNHYNESTYDIFYHWLKDYVRGWGDCDDFCTHAFGELLRQKKSLFVKTITWTEDPDFWVRRASAVILIPSILKNDYEGINPFTISDRLMFDEQMLVLKGYGWMLKALSQVNPLCVKEYLIKNCKKMPRIAYRYALDKFDDETRTAFLRM